MVSQLMFTLIDVQSFPGGNALYLTLLGKTGMLPLKATIPIVATAAKVLETITE